VQNENFLNAMQSSGDMVGYVQAAIETGALTPEKASLYLVSTYISGIENGNINLFEVGRAIDEGLLSGESLNAVQNSYMKVADIDYTNSNFFKDGNGKAIDENEAYNLVAEINENPLIPSEVKDKINSHYFDTYQKDGTHFKEVTAYKNNNDIEIEYSFYDQEEKANIPTGEAMNKLILLDASSVPDEQKVAIAKSVIGSYSDGQGLITKLTTDDQGNKITMKAVREYAQSIVDKYSPESK
jgi:hypothetical protein